MGLIASVVPYRHRFRRRATPRHAEEIRHALNALSDLLPGEGWEIGGGIALDAILGRFRRLHGDIDLHVAFNELAGLAVAAASHGYTLQRRVFWTRISWSRVLLLTREQDPAVSDPSQLGGLMLRRDPATAPNGLLVDLDLAVYFREHQRLVRQDRKIDIPRAWWRWTGYDTGSGSQVPLAHPRHLLAIKRRRAHPTDREDRRLLERWLAEHPEIP